MSEYKTIAGDTWDGICYKVYGVDAGLDLLLKANPKYCRIFIFPAGIVLNIPEREAKTDESLIPPWKRGTKA